MLNLLKLNRSESSFSFPGKEILEEMYDNFVFDSNLLIRPDGVISAGIVIKTHEEEQLDDSKMLEQLNHLSNIAKNLPVGTTLHFQKITNFTTYDLENKGDGYFMKNLKNHLNDRPSIRKKLNLYISFDFSHKTVKSSSESWLNIFGSTKSKKSDLRNIAKNIPRALNLVNGFLTQLNSLEHIKGKQISEAEFRNNLYEYYNLSFFKRGNERLQSTYHNHGNYVTAGQYKVATVSLHDVGSILFSSKTNERNVTDYMTAALDRLPFPNVVNTTLFIPDKEDALKALDFKNRLIQVFGKYAGQSAEVSSDEGEKFTKQLRESGDGVFHMDLNVMLWSMNENQLNDAINITKAAFNLMNNSTGIVSPHDALNFFTVFAPGMARDMFYPVIVTPQQAFCFPSLSSPMNSEKEGILFANRSGEPVYLNLFSEKLENKNAVIIGPSGSGKSVFGQYWIIQNYAMGYDQTIIDIGGSYRNVVELFGGKYFTHTESEPIQLNPFLMPKDQTGSYILDTEKLVFLRTLLSVLWKDNSKGEGLSKNEEAIIDELLTAYVVSANKNNDTPRLDKFYKFTESYVTDKSNHRFQSDLSLFDTKSFQLVLRKYSDPDSRYYKILNADEDKDISQYPLVAFDMAGVEKDPLVYPFMSLIIIDLVFSKFQKLPFEKRKYLFIDEAWSFLGKSPQLADFMESMFRTCRKMNAAAVLITQSVTELQTSKVGVPIRNNTALKILLDHSSQTSQLLTIREFLGFGDLEIQKIKSIRKGDKAREFFIKRGGLSQVALIDTGPHLMAGFTTLPEDRAKVNELIKRFGGNVQMALDYFVENYKKVAA